MAIVLCSLGNDSHRLHKAWGGQTRGALCPHPEALSPPTHTHPLTRRECGGWIQEIQGARESGEQVFTEHPCARCHFCLSLTTQLAAGHTGACSGSRRLAQRPLLSESLPFSRASPHRRQRETGQGQAWGQDVSLATSRSYRASCTEEKLCSSWSQQSK